MNYSLLSEMLPTICQILNS